MPAELGSLEHARQVVRELELVDWYNDEHYRVGLALLHPVDVHYGRVDEIVAARQRVLDDAHARHPERFVHGRPVQKKPPPAAWINPPAMDPIATDRIEEVIAHEFLKEPVSSLLTAFEQHQRGHRDHVEGRAALGVLRAASARHRDRVECLAALAVFVRVHSVSS